jgi:hypothetical protein
MIPTTEEGRARQEPLVRELEHASARPVQVEPHAAIAAGARHLVESTLVGLREPASHRPYDAEQAEAMRRRVLAFVVAAADQVAAVELRSGSGEKGAVTGALRAGRLAREVLSEELPVAPG